jgi:hypothetical protein
MCARINAKRDISNRSSIYDSGQIEMLLGSSVVAGKKNQIPNAGYILFKQKLWLLIIY